MGTARSLVRTLSLGTLFGAMALAAATRIGDAHVAVIPGPPWISIETPVNPFDGTTRDAYLLVHAFHHGTPMKFPVTGTAEGIVKGERRTVSLQFTSTSREGVFALRKQWSDDGIWTLVINVHQGENDIAQALVEIDTDGEVSRVRVPSVAERNMRIPRPMSARDIEAALRVRAGAAKK
jgi:hypothetical protein